MADGFGHALTWSYASPTSALVSQIKAPDGTVYGYGYDAGGRLSSRTAPDGGKRSFVYENAAFPNALTGILSESGNRKATFVYDAAGRVVSTIDAPGVAQLSVDYTWVSQGVAATTNAMGAKTALLYDGINGTAKLVQTYDATRNAFATTVYDERGNAVKRTDFSGAVTLSRYDGRNLLVVRADDHARHRLGLARGRDAPGNQRGAAK